jgi:hypothetical protein
MQTGEGKKRKHLNLLAFIIQNTLHRFLKDIFRSQQTKHSDKTWKVAERTAILYNIEKFLVIVR